MLAYGRRHVSLFTPFQVFGRVYTVIEVYDVKTMEIVRQLPSIDDEVNVACFSPVPGGGIAYGTKAGKLRLIRHESLADLAPGNVEPRGPEDDLLSLERVMDDEGSETEGEEDEGGLDLGWTHTRRPNAPFAAAAGGAFPTERPGTPHA